MAITVTEDRACQHGATSMLQKHPYYFQPALVIEKLEHGQRLLSVQLETLPVGLDVVVDPAPPTAEALAELLFRAVDENARRFQA